MPLSELLGFLQYYGFTPSSVAPLFVAGVVLYFFFMKGLQKIENRTDDIEKCIVEIESILSNKYRIQFRQGIANKYGKSNSPVVLKKEYRDLIKETDLTAQVDHSLSLLISWLKDKKPKTGLDAQDYIFDLVVSGEIEKYIDLTNFKQHLYETGKTSEDAEGILTIYLFEKLIPKVISM